MYGSSASYAYGKSGSLNVDIMNRSWLMEVQVGVSLSKLERRGDSVEIKDYHAPGMFFDYFCGMREGDIHVKPVDLLNRSKSESIQSRNI